MFRRTDGSNSNTDDEIESTPGTALSAKKVSGVRDLFFCSPPNSFPNAPGPPELRTYVALYENCAVDLKQNGKKFQTEAPGAGRKTSRVTARNPDRTARLDDEP